MNKKSKNSKKDKEPGVFAHNPFKTLKGLRPSGSVPVAPRATRTAPTDDTVDDTSLFLRAVRGARPVAPDGDDAGPPTAEPGPEADEQPDRDDNNERELFLQAMGTLKAAAVSVEEPEEEGAGDGQRRSRSSRMRQLRRGTIRISEELDLHGYLKDDALRRLHSFITAASARGLQAVLVITGKGINSPEGPVLPGAVAAWLREQGKGMVAEFFSAPRDKGGSGATVVFLKSK